MCKRANKTRNYISWSSEHWRIKGKWNCGTTICGGIDNANGRKGGKHHWGGSTTIYKKNQVIIETQLRAMEIERYQSTFMNESCGNFRKFKKPCKHIFRGGRLEGSKGNLKFQNAMWHHFKHFQSKGIFFLLPFFHSTWIILS
jgi:hypothetical protein